MKGKLIFTLLIFLGFAFPNQGMATLQDSTVSQTSQTVFGQSLKDIEHYIVANLADVNPTVDFKRSIIKIVLNEAGAVKFIENVNHPYTEVQEVALQNLIKTMQWQLTDNKRFFYLILEIEAGQVIASLRIA